MTCRHAKGDPACSSTVGGYAWAEQERYREKSQEANIRAKILEEIKAKEPSPENYEIIDFQQVDAFLVVKVKYPSCKDCAFDSCKVMVFPECEIADLVRWKRIDPHFHPRPKTLKEAPMPRARFPGDDTGWGDALAYAALVQRR